MRTRGARVLAATIGLVATAALGLGACAGGDDRVQVSGQEPAEPSTTLAPQTSAAPIPFDEARAKLEALAAPAGTVVARADGLVADAVPLRQAVRTTSRSGRALSVRQARRLTIAGGPFPYGGARIVVTVDGRSIGEGRPSADGRELQIAVLDPDVLRPGARIAYTIGARPTVQAGILGAVR